MALLRSSAMTLLVVSMCICVSMGLHQKSFKLDPMYLQEELMTMLDFENLGEEELGALNLVQTDASVERTSIAPDHEPTRMAVQADGSIDMQSQTSKGANDGMMSFSVDTNGAFHREDGLAMLQTEVESLFLKRRKEKKYSEPLFWKDPESQAASNDVEEVALMQTESRLQTKPASSKLESVAALADGTFEINPQTKAAASDGSMAFSVDQYGSFQQEDGLVLMQSSAEVSRETIELEQNADDHPHWSREAQEEDAEDLALMQTHAGMMSVAAQSDGTLEMNPTKAEPAKDGMMTFSVDGSGSFHYEI